LGRAWPALAAAAALLAGCGPSTEVQEEPGLPTAKAHEVVFGFNDNSVRAGRLGAEEAARLTKLAGGEVTRLGMDWRFLEPERDSYDWSAYDEIYKALTDQGIKPLWILLYAPPWAWEPGTECDSEDCRIPPGRDAEGEWDEILQEIAKRYPGSAGIEIWNEPNLTTFWQPEADPERYAQLLKRGYDAVKRVSPDMPVVLGGLSNRQTSDAGNVSLSEFLERIYAAGAKGHMDAISFHPYAAVRTAPVFAKSVLQVRDETRKAGDLTTPLWVTELGATTTGYDPTLKWSEDEQRETLVDQYEKLRRIPRVEMVLFHTLIDPIDDGGNPESGYGFLRYDESPRPVLCAFSRRRGAEGIRC
jgi:polysaccharide biosynthesis protein PslG